MYNPKHAATLQYYEMLFSSLRQVFYTNILQFQIKKNLYKVYITIYTILSQPHSNRLLLIYIHFMKKT
jgi:hypothetical protein